MAKKTAKKKPAAGAGKLAMRKKLIEAAKTAQKKAYCPYSRYPVGAAVLMESGRIYTGCNVENASFGLAICAERVAIFKAVSHGEKKVQALCVAAKSAKPCGACRQVLAEFGPPDLRIVTASLHPLEATGVYTLNTLLPEAFDANSLTR